MKKTLLIILWLSAGMSMTMAQKATLSFNPPPGKTYEHRYEMDQVIEQKVMGQDITTIQKMGTVYDVNILENTKDGIKTNYIYKSISYELKNSMMNVSYDSTQPKENPNQLEDIYSKMLGALVGKQFGVVHAPDGSVLSVTGMDAIADDIKNAFEDESIRNMIEMMLAQQYSNEAMKKTLNQSMQIYPNRAVKVGETWNIEQTADAMDIVLHTNSTYQLEAVKKKTAYVKVKATVTSDDDKLSGEHWGDQEFDLKSGMVRKATINQKMTGTITSQGMDIEMVIDSKVNMTMVE